MGLHEPGDLFGDPERTALLAPQHGQEHEFLGLVLRQRAEVEDLNGLVTARHGCRKGGKSREGPAGPTLALIDADPGLGVRRWPLALLLPDLGKRLPEEHVCSPGLRLRRPSSRDRPSGGPRPRGGRVRLITRTSWALRDPALLATKELRSLCSEVCGAPHGVWHDSGTRLPRSGGVVFPFPATVGRTSAALTEGRTPRCTFTRGLSQPSRLRLHVSLSRTCRLSFGVI